MNHLPGLVSLVVTFLSAQQHCWQARVSICVLYRSWVNSCEGLSTLQKFLGGRKHFPSGWSFSWLAVKSLPLVVKLLAIQKMGGVPPFLGCPQPKLDMIKMLSALVRTNIPGSQSIYTSRKLDLSRWQIDYLSAFINFTAVFSGPQTSLKTVKESGSRECCFSNSGQPTHVLLLLPCPTWTSRPRVQWSSWERDPKKVNWLRSTLKVKSVKNDRRNPICLVVTWTSWVVPFNERSADVDTT